jgi:hypothetical protein
VKDGSAPKQHVIAQELAEALNKSRVCTNREDRTGEEVDVTICVYPVDRTAAFGLVEDITGDVGSQKLHVLAWDNLYRTNEPVRL